MKCVPGTYRRETAGLVAAIAIASACTNTAGDDVVAPPPADNGASDDGGSTGSSGVSTSSGSGGSGSSSGSSGGGVDGGASSGGSSSGAALVVEAGADGGCPEQGTMVLGAHITVTVSWPSSAAASTGSGPLNIWLVANATATGNGGLQFSGPTSTCGLTLPDLTLNTLGAAAVCAPGLQCPNKVQIQILNSTFQKVARTFLTTGTQTDWNPGGEITTTPVLGLLGLSNAVTASTAWPPACASNCVGSGGSGNDGAFPVSEVQDDDGDGNPGITANPANNSDYSLPPTSITPFQVPPLADQVDIVSRNLIALDAKRTTDCAHGSGTATISLFDNHVVGCHIAKPAGACTSDQVSFLDTNRTVYGPTASSVATSSAPLKGTVTLTELPPGSTCASLCPPNQAGGCSF
jgi:hypothetical protein